MRIAFFHEVQKGGARRSVIEFGKRLSKQHTVDLYYVDRQPDTFEEKYFTNAFFYPFNDKQWKGKDSKTRLYKDTVELYKLYRHHKRIGDEINSKNYDLVFFNPSKFTQAPFLLRFIKTKKVYYCQEPLRMVYDPLLNKTHSITGLRHFYETFIRSFRKEIDKGNIQYADMLLANSTFTKRNIKKAYGLSSKVCYMGVDTKTFSPQQGTKDIDILYVGAYDFVDGYDLFEKTLSYFRKKPVIKILAREREWITSDRMLHNVYTRAKLTVCISYNEPFGLIPLESMACGTPVIALNQGGYKESVLDKKTGYLVKNDPREFSTYIKKLLKNEKMRSSFGKNARLHTYTNWDWDKQAKKLEKELRTVVGK